MTNTCDVCGEPGGVEMTTGRERAVLCDECRSTVVTFFHVWRSLTKAVSEVRRMKFGMS